jgi:ATP-binding cassette subfamily B protein/subfamily B ATP-binding cassette protein MsbA
VLQTFGNLKPVEASIERVLELLGPDAQEPQNAPAARVLASGATRGNIRLEGVTYGYEPERPVLRSIELDVRAGETVGLVGSTGAGKSTLVSLIPRFFDPWSGRVVLDGLDVREIQIESLRNQIGIVLQEPFLFPISVAENIAYGRLDATRDEIAEAARAANADDFIRRLPQRYDTVLGERGATLSGGERQRLSIARALLKNAPVLILDEPTSSLDSDTEALLLEALERLMTGRTTFVIAHRLSTIRRADRILVLEHGSIVEHGTHDQLLRMSGAYSRLHAHQYASALSGSVT